MMQPQVVWESGPRRIKDMIESKPMVSSIMITPLEERNQQEGGHSLSPRLGQGGFKKRSMMVGQPPHQTMKRSHLTTRNQGGGLNQPVISEEEEFRPAQNRRKRRTPDLHGGDRDKNYQRDVPLELPQYGRYPDSRRPQEEEGPLTSR